MINKDIRLRIISAGEKAVKELIKVAKEDIIKRDIDDESINISENGESRTDTNQGFAERRSK